MPPPGRCGRGRRTLDSVGTRSHSEPPHHVRFRSRRFCRKHLWPPPSGAASTTPVGPSRQASLEPGRPPSS
eukprot:9183913-Pyramimonas_sp.AAC.1